MFNEAISLTAETRNILYKEMAVKNIDFALISLRYIMDDDPCVVTYGDQHTYYFYYLQNLFAACGNIANIFNSTIGFHYANAPSPLQRSRELRQQFGIEIKDYPLIFNRIARNTNMHFDERYDEYIRNIGDYNILDRNTPLQDREIILNTPHLRTYDKERKVYITLGKQGQPIEYDLTALQRQLNRLKEKLCQNQ